MALLQEGSKYPFFYSIDVNGTLLLQPNSKCFVLLNFDEDMLEKKTYCIEVLFFASLCLLSPCNQHLYLSCYNPVDTLMHMCCTL